MDNLDKSYEHQYKDIWNHIGKILARNHLFHEKAVHPDHREEYSTEGRELDPVVEHPRTTLTAYKAYYTSKGELLLEPDFSGTWRTANEPRSIIEMVIPRIKDGKAYWYCIYPLMTQGVVEAEKLAAKLFRMQIEGKDK